MWIQELSLAVSDIFFSNFMPRFNSFLKIQKLWPLNEAFNIEINARASLFNCFKVLRRIETQNYRNKRDYSSMQIAIR